MDTGKAGDTGHMGMKKSLGSIGIIFLSFSALSPVVSVYVFGAGVIGLGGTGAVPALLIGGTIAAIIGLLYAEIGAAYPDAGGMYPSFSAILGPRWAFPYIAMMILAAPTSLAFQLLGFADYVRVLFPSAPPVATALACLAVAGGIALLSIRTGALITGLFLGVELLALAVLTMVALLHPARSIVSTIAHPVLLSGNALVPTPLPMIGLAIIASIYTCAGANWALYFAGELTDAERRIGRVVTIISPLAALLIAGPLIAALLSAGDLRAVLANPAPIAAILQANSGPAVATMVSIGVLIAVFNAIVATIMGYGRFFYATGRDGIWPRPLGKVMARLSPRFDSPIAATLVLAGCGAAALALGERILLILCSNQLVLEFVLLGLAVLLGRSRGQTGIHHRTWLHPLVPIVAIATTAGMIAGDWLDPDAGRPALFMLAAVIAASLVYDRFRVRGRPEAAAFVEEPVVMERI